MISREDFIRSFQGYYIVDCAVRSKSVFSFIAFENADDGDKAQKRMINYFADRTSENNIGVSQYSGFIRPKLAISRIPKEQALMVSSDGGVAVLGGGDDDMEQSIPMGGPDQPLYTSAHGVVTIDGYVYTVGGWRGVCRRIGPNQWESVGDRTTLPVPKRNSFGSNDEGFKAIDGFSVNDIYCAGGRGDAWRFDGNRWYQCALPTNMILENVCCAGDGYVYIGMQSGSVMRGRENSWEIIHKGEFTLPFKDMVWFDNRVWCTSDYGIWTIEDGKLIEPDLPAEVRSCSGNLSVGDGVMLLAGMYGATVYDGKVWTPLIRPIG
jgi:hypothetical protein